MSKQDDDEIDLRELALSIWSGRYKIAVTTVSAALAAGFYAFSVEPTYKAEAMFALKSSSSGPGIPSEYAGLAALAGYSSGGDDSKGVFDRLMGRDFIQRLSVDLSLEADPYFNPSPGPERVLSLAGLKRALGVTGEAGRNVNVQDNVTKAYREAITVSETENGSIKVVVTHDEANRAAEIANGLVSLVVSELAAEKKQEQRDQLDYLSSELADALAQMDDSKKAVADFALANSLGSPAAFVTRSQAMFDLREALRRAQEMAAAVADLSEVMAAARVPGPADQAALRLRAPIVDDVDFRRLIGVPEALDAWEWPPRARLGDFTSTLRDRTARIERSLVDLREEADRYATSTEMLAAREREARVAEATYNLLIEQVKAQGLATGYEGDIARIYQSATPPQLPSTPKKKLILALGAVLGLVVGSGLSLLSAARSGRIFSGAAIAEASGAALTLRVEGLQSNSTRTTKRLAAAATKVSGRGLSELLVALKARPSKVSLIAATAPQIGALPAALWLARRMQGGGHRTTLLVLGDAIPKDLFIADYAAIPSLSCAVLDGISILVPSQKTASDVVLTSDAVRALLSDVDGTFDRVIIAAASDQVVTVARAFAEVRPRVILLTRAGQTLRPVLEGLRRLCPTDAIVSLAV